jgi:hypothetical protein
MGFDELLKEGEQALNGQTAANEQTANQTSGSGNMATEDTIVDSCMTPVLPS